MSKWWYGHDAFIFVVEVMLPSIAMDDNHQPGELLRQFFILTKDKQLLLDDIKIAPWNRGVAVPRNTSLLVPCIAASRVGSDVSAAYSVLNISGILGEAY